MLRSWWALRTAGMLGSEQYVVPVFLQYEFEKPTMALRAFATFSSCSSSALALATGSTARRTPRPPTAACGARSAAWPNGANALQPTAKKATIELPDRKDPIIFDVQHQA